jgi:hypothetical protein
MKIRLIEIDDEQTQQPIKESPPLRLDRTEPLQLADWAHSIMEIETWQGHQLELNRLEKLMADMQNHTETRIVTRWKINDKDQDIEVDLSLVLGILSRELLRLDPQNKQRALILE